MTKPRVFVALDFPDGDQAFAMMRKLLPFHSDFKVGLELFSAEGPDLVSRLKGEGAKVFLDLKFHDIPNTVAGAVRSATRLGVDYLNIHCGGGSAMIKAAAEACREEAARLSIPRPKLLGVTVLTSLDDLAIQEIGFPRSASQQVLQFVNLAKDNGLDGVVCSAQELPLVRDNAGADFITMIPGIRPAGSAAGDQKRTLTPSGAVQAGAHCLVVGRPVTGAADPEAALKAILKEVGI